MKDYVAVTYDEKRKPYTDYPFNLAVYLHRRFKMTPYQTLIDVGCGRGEYAKAFSYLGLRVTALDRSNAAQQYGYFCNYKFIRMDFEGGFGTSGLSFIEKFDYVFIKSVIEHLHGPEHLINDMWHVLKPGGRIIVMTPDWSSSYKDFYGDYLHRSPFCIDALRDILLIAGYNNVKVEKFLQLPILWKHPWLSSVARLAQMLPKKFADWSYFVRWSQAVMLLGTGTK